MNEIHNPYNPGAGVPPPELAGRDDILDQVGVAITRALNSKPAKNFMLLGLRGVGKTVLLQRVLGDADETCVVQDFEANPDRTLAEQMTEHLYRILIGLDRRQRMGHEVKRALGMLRSFATVFEVKAGDYAIGVSESRVTGNLAIDLTDLFVAVGKAARQRNLAVVLAVDEVQYLVKEDLTALIIALHKVAQLQLPLVFLGAGLPQLAKLAGEARSYAERLFVFPEIGKLSEQAARSAIMIPAENEGVAFEEDAVDRVLQETECYPYFLQVWGDHAWRAANSSPVTLADVREATVQAIRHLDEGFFRVRFDRLNESEQKYAHAMAALGSGPVKSPNVAKELGMPVTRAAPIRGRIIKKGMVYSPSRGMVAFTVPGFDDFLRRMVNP